MIVVQLLSADEQSPRNDIPRRVLDLEVAVADAVAEAVDDAGGARMWMDETIGKRINVARVEQALPLAPRVIATACPYCNVMVSDGTKALPQAETIDTRDIAELVDEALVI